MRHTSATLSLMAGVPIHVVSEKLGHASTDDHVEHIRARAAVRADGRIDETGGAVTRVTLS